jgi:recombinational DNA repair protein (RecF pathway)
MSENIVKGYIIDRRIYKSFDEILLVLIADGQRLPMLALGTKKINSKNARNLHYGSLIEFIIFQSRTVGKMSKLRTATILKEND